MMTPHSLRACLYGCAAASLSLPALAADGGAFELGVVEVIGPRATPPASKQTVINQSLLRQFNRDTLGEAVGLTPGLSVSRNSRNEDTVYLRGFDIRQVPLFIDGIPAYVGNFSVKLPLDTVELV
jgi:iron complex outermembrane receptor protein